MSCPELQTQDSTTSLLCSLLRIAGGYAPAELDRFSTNKAAVRGREQQLIDFNGGAQSEGGTSRNKIRGVSRNNVLRGTYDAAATAEFKEKLPNNNPVDKKTL